MQGTVVTLRALEEDDLPVLHQWNFDPEITRYFTSRWPVSMTEQKKWFDGQVNDARKKRLVVTDRSTGRAIGILGIMDIDHVNKNCEIGITIGDRTYWGQQHAKEAMELALRFLFMQLNMHLVYLRVMEDNERAVAFFQKCGFTKSGLLRDMVFVNGTYHCWVWMSITQAEFVSYDAS
jgi:RimJ/RimL family protein N-acetyltransferase